MKEWNPQLETFEYKLHQKLRTYHPDPEFVTTLKRRLTTEPDVAVESYQKENHTYIRAALVIVGLAAVLIMLKSIFRAR